MSTVHRDWELQDKAKFQQCKQFSVSEVNIKSLTLTLPKSCQQGTSLSLSIWRCRFNSSANQHCFKFHLSLILFPGAGQDRTRIIIQKSVIIHNISVVSLFIPFHVTIFNYDINEVTELPSFPALIKILTVMWLYLMVTAHVAVLS